jgi:membrane-associated phospholipid phosphatase
VSKAGEASESTGRRYLWLLPGVLLAGAACLFLALYVDREVAIWVNALPLSVKRWFDRLGEFGNSVYYLVPGPVVYLLLRRAVARAKLPEQAAMLRRWQQRILYLVATVLASGLVADVIKILCGRPRPKVFFGKQLYSFSFFQFSAKMWSFPSGHSTTIFAVATAGFLLMPRRRLLWFAPAALVAACRVLAGAHFTSDVVAGAFIGTVTSILVRDYFQRRQLLDFPRSGENGERF